VQAYERRNESQPEYSDGYKLDLNRVTVAPPSMIICAPVTWADAGLARKRANEIRTS
jgi:hypothetical protein